MNLQLGDLAKVLTSPGKLAFAAYILLIYRSILPRPSVCGFVLVALLFIVVQVAHDDWLRIVLNKCAERKCYKPGCPGCGRPLT